MMFNKNNDSNRRVSFNSITFISRNTQYFGFKCIVLMKKESTSSDSKDTERLVPASTLRENRCNVGMIHTWVYHLLLTHIYHRPKLYPLKNDINPAKYISYFDVRISKDPTHIGLSRR